MISSWWWFWLVFMFVFLVFPIGYGSGYRRWGPPYPRYIQRRRSQRAPAAGDYAPWDHQSWGWGGDFVWMALLIGMFWVAAALLWR